MAQLLLFVEQGVVRVENIFVYNRCSTPVRCQFNHLVISSAGGEGESWGQCGSCREIREQHGGICQNWRIKMPAKVTSAKSLVLMGLMILLKIIS